MPDRPLKDRVAVVAGATRCRSDLGGIAADARLRQEESAEPLARDQRPQCPLPHLRGGTPAHRTRQIVVTDEHECDGEVGRGHLFEHPCQPDLTQPRTTIGNGHEQPAQLFFRRTLKCLSREAAFTLPGLGVRRDRRAGPCRRPIHHRLVCRSHRSVRHLRHEFIGQFRRGHDVEIDCS